MNSLKKWLFDGNVGSNILGLIAMLLVGAHINLASLLNGVSTGFSDPASHAEILRVAGIVAVGLYAFFVGKYPVLGRIAGDVQEALKDGGAGLGKMAEDASSKPL
jgi:hypothetical protein